MVLSDNTRDSRRYSSRRISGNLVMPHWEAVSSRRCVSSAKSSDREPIKFLETSKICRCWRENRACGKWRRAFLEISNTRDPFSSYNAIELRWKRLNWFAVDMIMGKRENPGREYSPQQIITRISISSNVNRYNRNSTFYPVRESIKKRIGWSFERISLK